MLIVFPPSQEELDEAKSLGIEGADKMTAPTLRTEIKKAKLRKQKPAELSPAARRMRNLRIKCKRLGVKRAATTLPEQRELYERVLRNTLESLGVIKDKTIYVPHYSDKLGEATVGEIWPINALDDVGITLKYANERRAKVYDAWTLWQLLTGNK